MSNGVNNQTTKIRKEKTKELTSYLLHKHYCENDEDALIEHFDEYFSWLGTGEQEYAVGYETVKDIFRKFSGKVIKCNISDECYDVIEAAPDVYVCSGRLWISTDPSTQTYLRVHQRITTVFRVYSNGAPMERSVCISVCAPLEQLSCKKSCFIKVSPCSSIYKTPCSVCAYGAHTVCSFPLNRLYTACFETPISSAICRTGGTTLL